MFKKLILVLTAFTLIRASEINKVENPFAKIIPIKPLQLIIAGYLDSYEKEDYVIPHGGTISITYSPNSQFLVLSKFVRHDNNDDDSIIWDNIAKSKLRGYKIKFSRDFIFSPSSKQLLIIINNHIERKFQIIVKDTKSWEDLYTDNRNTGISGNATGYSPDGALLISGSLDKLITLMPADIFKYGRLFPIDGTVQIMSLDFTPDSNFFAVSFCKNIRIWHRNSTGRIQASFSLDFEVACLKFLSNTQLLAISVFGEVKIWDIAKNQLVKQFKIKESSYSNLIRKGDLSINKKLLAILMCDNAILIDLASSDTVFNLDKQDIIEIKLSPNSKEIAIIDRDKLSLYDISTGKMIKEFEQASNRKSQSQLAFSPTGKYVAIGSDNETQIYKNQAIELEEVLNSKID